MRGAATLALVLVLPLGVAGCAGSPGTERTGEPAFTLSAADDAARRSDALIAQAIADTRAARATGESSRYDTALEALEAARALEPARARVDLVEAWVRLGRHEFATAEALAQAALEADAGNPDAWALLGDARLELGRYDEAGDAYDRLLALRPGSASYVRAAHFRQATGDLDGAAELYRLSLDTGDRRDAEGRAWLLVQLAALEVERDEPDTALALLEEALRTVPDYHSALAALSAVELRRGRAAEALALADRVLAVAPHAERHLLRADALHALGRDEEAREAENDFERAALANVARADNENNFLVDFYLERRPDRARALEIARAEAQRRPDKTTLEHLARALEQNGFAQEAHAVRARTRGSNGRAG